MKMLNTSALVPAYYQNRLMAILLLGEKPLHGKYEQEELDFLAALASDAAMAIRNAQLFTGLEKEAKRNKELFIQTIVVLCSTIEAKDEYTHGHTERVTSCALNIARQMNANGSAEFDGTFMEHLYISGLMHDIGKIAIPEAILNKPGKLTKEEFDLMKTHTTRGFEIVQPLRLPNSILDGILYHHERFDGKGYPQGLAKEAVPPIAAIMAVADAYDAMTSDRPYRKSLDKSTAIAEVKKNTGTQFHPDCAKAFLELSEQGKI